MKESINMNVLMTGGTGFIGSRLANKLVEKQNHVFILTRQPSSHNNSKYITFINNQYPMQDLPTIDTVVNLAGESLFGYWTEKKKQNILASRLQVTENIIDIIRRLKSRPKVFLSGSAVGYYGNSENAIFTENSPHAENDFLADVTQKWEFAAMEAEALQIRTVFARFGVVLDKKQGALPMMALPVKLFIGGKIGKGMQWVSWIHIEDCINLLLFALENEAISGPLNITSPHPLRNREFTKTLAKTMKRPSFFTTPKVPLRILLGEMNQLITEGQYVYPQKAVDHQFDFKFPHLDDAFADIYK